MKKEFDGLTIAQSQDFIRYFKASIRDPRHGMIPGDGTSSFVNGLYVTQQAVTFKYKEKKLFVIWKITQHPDGRLHSIENLNSVGDLGNFDKTLYKFIVDILVKVITGKKTDFFQRTYLTTICGGNLPGEYWISGFRFAPLFPEDDSALINAERIFVIDQTIKAVDNIHAQEIARSNTATIASCMSFVLDVGLDNPVHEEKYYLHRENGFKMLRHSTQLIDTNAPKVMPQKGEICKHIRFEGSVFEPTRYAAEALTCPTETRKIFKKVSQSSDDIQSGFYAACRMYQLALILGQRRPTVRTAYQYGAIDSIVKSNISTYLSFTDFMTKYSEADREICELIHSKIRSAHWHAGHLPLGEMRYGFESLYDASSIPLSSFTRTAHKLMRIAVLNWLDEQVDFSGV